MTRKINLILHSEAYVNIYLSYDERYFYCLRNAISAVFDVIFQYCILSGLILHFGNHYCILLRHVYCTGAQTCTNVTQHAFLIGCASREHSKTTQYCSSQEKNSIVNSLCFFFIHSLYDTINPLTYTSISCNMRFILLFILFSSLFARVLRTRN